MSTRPLARRRNVLGESHRDGTGWRRHICLCSWNVLLVSGMYLVDGQGWIKGYFPLDPCSKFISYAELSQP